MTRQVEMQVVVVDEAGEREWLTKQTSAAKRELVKAEKEIRSEIETMARSGMNIAHRLAYLYEHRVIDYALGIELADRSTHELMLGGMRSNHEDDRAGQPGQHLGVRHEPDGRGVQQDPVEPGCRLFEQHTHPIGGQARHSMSGSACRQHAQAL